MQILVTGASGRLGSLVLPLLAEHGHQVVAWSGSTEGERFGFPLARVDLGDPAALRSAIRDANPDVVIHAGAKSSADFVRHEPVLGWNVNASATAALSAWALENGRRLLFTSTDVVFEGTRSWYREGDPANPIVGYGRTKLAAEAAVQSTSRGLVVRLSLLYGPSGAPGTSFFDRAIAAIAAGTPQTFFDDEFRTPLSYATAAQILVRLAESDATGTIHAGGAERVSRFDLMRRAARALGAEPEMVRANRRGDLAAPEPRPADLSLDTSLLRAVLPDLAMPTIEQALAI